MKRTVLLGLLIACATPAPAQVTSGRELTVATRVVPPLVYKDGETLKGFSIDLWRALADQLSVRTTFVEKPTLPALFEEIAEGRADLAIAAISITAERERRFDFSQPMLDAGLQILVASNRGMDAGELSNFMSFVRSRGFLELLGVMILLILAPVPFVWLFERRHGASFIPAEKKAAEFAKSLWWTSSTLAGQATDMPSSFAGRILAVVWMFVGVVFISYFTATITAGLTVKKLEASIGGPQDLVGKRVASIAGSTGAAFLMRQSMEVVEFPQIADAVAALADGRIDAIVYDAPVLQYYAAREGKGKVQVIGPIFRPENYGILFPSGSPLRKSVNEALLRLRETGEYQVIKQRWFQAEMMMGN